MKKLFPTIGTLALLAVPGLAFAGPLNGTEAIVSQCSISSPTLNCPGTTSGAVAALAKNSPAPTVTNIATAGNGTLTAAGLLSGVITRTGPAGAFTDTLDTAANIIAALPANTPLSSGYYTIVRNTTPFNETIQSSTGVTLAGLTVIPATSAGVLQIQYTGAATVTITVVSAGPISGGTGLVANNNLTTVGAGTVTATQIVGGVVTRSGPTANFTDTTDTAANIIAALPSSGNVGQSWFLTIVNTVAFNETFSAGGGVTLSGLSGPVPGNSSSTWLVTYTSASAVTMQLTRLDYNVASGALPSNSLVFGGGSTTTASLVSSISKNISSAGSNPGNTGGDYVLASFSIPASYFDQANRCLRVRAYGKFAATGNTKEVKINFNPASATVGSAVGAGGTVIADTGATTQNGGGWQIEGDVCKYGAAGSNTQIGVNGPMSPGVPIAPALATATESGAIFIAITGNATTTATDIVYNEMIIDSQN